MKRLLEIDEFEIQAIERAGQQLITSDSKTAYPLLALALRWRYASEASSDSPTGRLGTTGDTPLSLSPPLDEGSEPAGVADVVHLYDWSRRV